jgi:hypothetical protein
LAKKHYQSLVRLLEHSGVDLSTQVNLPRLKKQLAAEFDFSGSGFIEIDGYSYNKADVFAELDAPDFDQRLQYHIRIWKSKAVLSMLELAAFNYLDFKDEIKEFSNDEKFDQFFSPYFADSYVHVLRQYITEVRFDEVSLLLLFEPFLMSEEREEAFAPLRIFFEEQQRLLRNVNRENYPAFKKDIYIWSLPYWGRMFNNLPDELFEYRAEFAFHLVNLTVALQHKYTEDALAISTELTIMKELPADLEKTILSNHKVYKQGTGGSISWGWVIWIVLILLRLAAGC